MANYKSPINVRSLVELIDLASPRCLRRFIGIAECQGAWAQRDWPQVDGELSVAMLEAIGRGQKDEVAAAEREAWRIQRLSTAAGAQVLMTVADQLNDNDLLADFMRQAGGQIGRAIWMRTHSAATNRLFEVAESILLTNEVRVGNRLYDAYEVPCEDAPPFVWNARTKARLEKELMKAMRLDAQPEIVHLELVDDSKDGSPSRMHCLVIRCVGARLSVVRVQEHAREEFSYQPTRDAILLYAPRRRIVEVFAHNLALRAPMVEVLSRYGFATALSDKPLRRARYDLSAFTRPLKHVRPRLGVGTVERLYVLEAKALLGHASDTVKVEINSGAELHEVMASRWSQHPFLAPEMLLRVTLAADVVFHGDVKETPLAITVAKPGRCSLQCEHDPRIRQAGQQLLEHLGVCWKSRPEESVGKTPFLLSVCRLIEISDGPVDGFALQDMGIDIELFANEGILVDSGRITRRRIECAPGQDFHVDLERCADGLHVRYQDPLSGVEVLEPVHLARRWSIQTRWLHDEILSALGTQLTGMKAVVHQGSPDFLGDITIDGAAIPVYFAPRMGDEASYRAVDLTLRLRPRLVPGIVLTSAARPFPFAGANVVIPIEDVLGAQTGSESSVPTIDHEALAVAYRHSRLAARGGAGVALQVSADRQSGVLIVPGKAPWSVTGRMKITVLDRLVQAHAAGPSHIVTKVLLAGTGCDSLDGLFGADSVWREYIERVEGTRAWRLIVDGLSIGEGRMPATRSFEHSAPSPLA